MWIYGKTPKFSNGISALPSTTEKNILEYVKCVLTNHNFQDILLLLRQKRKKKAEFKKHNSKKY